MDITHIYCFLALAETLSFAKAAEREHISQSALSRRIQNLELELNAILFERNTRNVRLTEAGKEFYLQSSKLIEQYKITIDATKKAVNGYSRKLRIGIGYYEHFFLMPFIGKFSKQYPHVHLFLYQFVYEKLVEHFIRGNLDIILSSDQYLSSISEKKFLKRLLWSQSWSLYLSKDNSLSQFPIIGQRQLKGQNIISMYNGMDSMIRNIYHNQNFEEPFNSIIQVNSYEAKMTLINANLGIGFAPSFVNFASYSNIVRRPMDPSYSPRKFYILCQNSSYDETIKDFLVV